MFRKADIHLSFFSCLILGPILSWGLQESGDETIPVDEDFQNRVSSTRSLKKPTYESFEGSGWNVDDDEYELPEIVPSHIVPVLSSPSILSALDSTRDYFSNYSSNPNTYITHNDGSGDDADVSTAFYYSTPKILMSSTSLMDLSLDFKNTPPLVNKKLQKIAVTVGKMSRFFIPEDTFLDKEDGDARNMTLFLKKTETKSSNYGSWIKFDDRNLEILALPIDPNFSGRYEFALQAIDSSGASVTTELEVLVRMHPSFRLFNHKFIIKFLYDRVNIDLFHLTKHLSQYFNGELRGIVVREAGDNYLAWTYEALSTQSCPLERIQSVKKKIMQDSYNLPTEKFRSFLKSLIVISSVNFEFEGLCYEDTITPSIKVDDNSQPKIRNPINRLDVTAGELLRFQVPQDTCHDKEDRFIENLEMHILTMSRKELSPNGWLQFDSKNKVFYGVPLEEEVGREEYQLVFFPPLGKTLFNANSVCSDSQGLSAIDGIEVVVSTRPFSERYLVEFDFYFSKEPYSSNHLEYQRKKVKFVEQLAKYFGDLDESNIVIQSINDDFSQVVWYNKSFINTNCKTDEINWMKSRLWETPGDLNKKKSNIKADLIEIFSPYLKLIDVNIMLKGSCIDRKAKNEDSPEDDDNMTIFHGILTYSDYILTFIFPAIIIIGMMFLALILACLLHKKRKAGKLNIFYSENLPPRVPVILQDELNHNNQNLLGRRQLHNSSSSKKNIEESQKLIQKSSSSDISFSRPAPVYQRR